MEKFLSDSESFNSLGNKFFPNRSCNHGESNEESFPDAFIEPFFLNPAAVQLRPGNISEVEAIPQASINAAIAKCKHSQQSGPQIMAPPMIQDDINAYWDE